MNKAKLIQTLSNLPEEFFATAYDVNIRRDEERSIKIQMIYNNDLVKQLMNANRWKYELNDNGFMAFKRDDGLEIVMT